MKDKKNSDFDVDKVLSDLFKPAPFISNETLQELFDRRISELNISRTNALDILQIERLTLLGILQGKQKRADFTNLIKIAHFLKVPKEEVIRLYLNVLEHNFPDSILTSPEKVEFIKNNFDLAVLKKAGFIDSINDFTKIESKILTHFKLKSIFDYKRPNVEVAFSSGQVTPKNELTRDFWLKNAMDAFEQINNPYDYNRKALIEYFPQIRRHSMNVELGLLNIVKDLYKLGITIIYQPSMPDLHLRGATFPVNNKPCIVLSNYVGFYPTLWFALIHELFHVIFDWEEISHGSFHFSEEKSERLTVVEKEEEADNFAREYLLPTEKMAQINTHLNDRDFVYDFAITNHVHPSFIYVFYAYDKKNSDRMAWARARKHNPPNMGSLLSKIENPWSNSVPVLDFFRERKYKLYN